MNNFPILKMLLRVSIILALVGFSMCATWRAKLPEIPDKFAGKEGCYIKETDDVVAFGKMVTPIGYCYRIQCSQQHLFYASCGTVLAAPPCVVTEKDLTKPYPDCCPQVKCPSSNTV